MRVAVSMVLVLVFAVSAAGCDDRPCADFGLYLARPDGSDLHRVTPNGEGWPAHETEVARAGWLPGGRLLGVRGLDCPSPWLVVRDDGSVVSSAVTDVPGFEEGGTTVSWLGPAYAPTGFRVTRPGTRPQSVRFPQGFEVFPCDNLQPFPQVSPDGKFVVYATGTESGTATQLYVLDVTRAGKPRRLLKTRSRQLGLTSLTWSPNSRTIAVGSDHILLINIDGSGLHSIPQSGGIAPFAWSPSGRSLAISTSSGVDIVDLRGNVLQHPVTGNTFDVAWAPANKIALIKDNGAPTRPSATIDRPRPTPKPRQHLS